MTFSPKPRPAKPVKSEPAASEPVVPVTSECVVPVTSECVVPVTSECVVPVTSERVAHKPTSGEAPARKKFGKAAWWRSPLPERPWTFALVGVSVVATVWLFAHILLFRYGRDQGIYAVVADAVLRGEMPYRDAWDFKPPGIFVVYAAARALLGSAQWCIRALEVAGLASMVAGFFVLARRFFGDGRIGIVGGVLAVLVHAQLEFWHTAQPESFGGVLVVWAFVLATYEPADRDRHARLKQYGALALAGAIYTAAGLLKPPLVGGAAVSACFATFRIYRRRSEHVRELADTIALGHPVATPGAPPRHAALPRWRALARNWAAPSVAMAAGGAFVLASCALWFVAKGAWRDLYETLFVFTPHYTRLTWEGVSFPGLFYLAFEEWALAYSSINTVVVIAAVVMRPIADREREGLLHLLGIVFIQLVGVAMQRKFFPYHYGATLLLSGLLGGLGAFKLWQHALRWGPIAVAAFAFLAWGALLGRTATRNTETDFWERCDARQSWLFGSRSPDDRDRMDGKLYSVADVNYDANRRVAEFLRERLAPDDRIFVWGFEPIIYDLSQRRPASRFLYNVPQRVAWYRETAQSRLMADLDAHPPRAIVVEHRDVFPAVTGNAIDSADSLRTFPALAARLQQAYTLEAHIEDLDVYVAHR